MHAFLFTDLESSTRLWEQHPDQMKLALADHDAILRRTVAAASGEVVKLTGDGMLAVFESVAAALDASIAAQAELIAVDWPTPEPLRVRMGVHAGEGESRDGDYFGPAVNRAARIMAAAHGTQVLVSGVVAALAIGAFDGEFRDLGVHRLKDLTLPEHLYQVVHHSIPSDFPAPSTLEARPNNLPSQVSEFFGRVDELSTIRVMLGSPMTRLLTLTGPGGAGKTRLGLQVAAEQLNDFRDGVFFVDLAPETDADAAYEAIARVLTIPVAGGGHPLEVLKSRLRDQHTLLVLDNFEQVTEAAAGVAEVIQSCPGVKVLVTSREALRVRAEHIFPVPPLSLPNPSWPVEQIAATEAVQLFVERARTVKPDFGLSSESAPTVAEICLRLDGLPLAIELAAARLNVFTPFELMKRLRERLDVLGAGGRDLPARQRTLWGAIGWSYELLDERECEVFQMMAVFSATALDALEAVAATALDRPSILDALASLVDKSLIRSDDSGGQIRFVMLQTMKEFAAERLAESSDRELRVREAHARFFSDLAVRVGGDLRSDKRAAALDELSAAIGNLRTAWRFWVDQGDLGMIFALIDTLWALHDARGWYHSAIELAHDALGVLAATEPTAERSSEELTLRTSLARALMAVQGYTVEVEEAFKNVLELSEASGGLAAQRFPVLRALATYYMNLADFESARRVGVELLELADRDDDPTIRIDAHYVFGAASAFAGDLATGLSHLDRAIALFDPRIHPVGRFRLGPSQGVVARTASGLLLWQCGSLEPAVTRLDEALAIARDLDHPFSLAYALFHHGLFQVYRSRFTVARERAVELAEVAGRHDYAVWSTLASVLEGAALTGLGQVEEGLELTEAGVRLYMGLTTPPVFWPLILATRGQVFAAAGDLDRALELVDEAIEKSGAVETISPEFRVLRGDILRMLPDPDSAAVEDAYEAALRGAQVTGLGLVELRALSRIVDFRRSIGRTPDRSEELRGVISTFAGGFEEADLVTAAALLE